MYRVAKRGVLAFEARDSLSMRITERLGLTQEYEVAENECCGVNATEIPNYIYRWTEREVEKTIKSFSPTFKHKFFYKYATRYPNGFDVSKSKKLIIKFLYPFFLFFSALFPKQQNNFIFFIEKPTIRNSLLPWLVFNDNEQKIKYNKIWVDQNYKKLKNRHI